MFQDFNEEDKDLLQDDAAPIDDVEDEAKEDSDDDDDEDVVSLDGLDDDEEEPFVQEDNMTAFEYNDGTV